MYLNPLILISLQLQLCKKMPSVALLLLSMTIIFVSGPSPVLAGEDEGFLSCSNSFDCGNIRSIAYPFARSDQPEYCGYPGFRLDCSGETPVITIKQLTYNVLNINNASRTLTVVRTDYKGSICQSKLLNTTLDLNLFAYSLEDQNITLYYDCPMGQSTPSSSLPFSVFSSRFTCLINQVETLGFYLTRTMSFLGIADDYLGLCKHRVFVTVYQTAIPSIGSTLSDVVEALKQGFGLQWSDNIDTKCHACLNSGGKCGYDRTASAFTCYCPDKAYEGVCATGTSLTNIPEGQNRRQSSKKLSTGAGIGIAAGAVVVVAFLGIWFFAIKRRRKRTEFLRMQSRDMATPPSSKDVKALPPKLSQSIPSYLSSKSDLEKGSTYFGVQMFNYDELVEATDGFNPSRELGDGGFGTVYYGLLKDGRAVAVKRLYDNNLRRAEQFINEVEILARLRHKNLVTLYGCTSRRSQELLLVYEFIPNGTVADHLHERRPNSVLLPWPVRLSIAIETADALAYLHGLEVIHRDVKTNNILLDSNFSVKVADFGLSRLFPADVTHVSTAPQGTPGYVDPEYYQCYQLTNKSDVYSFGVVLIELISSLEAVDTSRHRHDINLGSMAINKIQNHALNELVDPSLGFEKDNAVRSMVTSVAELAFRCLQQERDMRPTMAEALFALRRIQNENYGDEKVLVVDVGRDDVGLLKHAPPPFVLSPNTVTEKWTSDSTLPTPDSSASA